MLKMQAEVAEAAAKASTAKEKEAKVLQEIKTNMVEELDEKGEVYRKARGSDLGEESDVESNDDVASTNDMMPVKKGSAETYGVTTDEDEDEEEEVKVKPFQHKGKTYYRSPADNLLYDTETSECIGIWNEVTQEIDDVAEFGSDGRMNKKQIRLDSLGTCFA